MSEYRRTILVTGSNTGLGYEIVRLLAERRHTVYLSARNEAKGKEAREKLKNEHKLDVKFVRLDVTDDESIVAAKEYIERDAGHLDVLVNNAGAALLDNLPQHPDAWGEITQEIFKINLFGVVQVNSTFLPLIRKARPGYGVILNITSTTASNTLNAQGRFSNLSHRSPASSYTAAKAALNAYTIALGHMLKPEGIKVNCGTLGLTATNLNFFKVGKPASTAAEGLIPWILLGPEDAEKTIKFAGPEEFAEPSGEMLW